MPTGVALSDPLLTEAAAMIAAYLAAERDLGRLTWEADVATLAPTLLGAGHLLFAGRDTPPAPATVHRTVATVMASVVQEPRPVSPDRRAIVDDALGDR